MLYPSFAYSPFMQIILFLCTCGITVIAFWFITTIILTIYGEKISTKQRLYFVLLAGILLTPIWTYSLFVLGGFIAFSPWVYKVITIPNPVFALLYYFIGSKTLHLSGYRLIHLMRHVYMYWMIIQMFFQVTGKLFFMQTEANYNYLLDTFNLGATALLILPIQYLLVKLLRSDKALIKRLHENQPHSLTYELFISFIQASAIYLLVLCVPALMNETALAYMITFVMLTLWLICSILLDALQSANIELENKDVHIGALISSIDKFSAIKHDFYNILQTYSGYLFINNIDSLKKYHEKLLGTTLFAGDQIQLGRRMQQNPALISLLMDKQKKAEKNDISLLTTILCPIENLYIGDIDLCRIMANLLDNAIESAIDSPQKRITVSIEQKSADSKLIVISNSTAEDVPINTITISGVTTKAGRPGMGIPQARKLIRKYRQCSLWFSYYHYELSVYIELRPDY